MKSAGRVADPTGPRIEPPARLFYWLKWISPWAYRTLHRDLGLRGFGDLARHLWTNWTFDRRHGVRTEFLVDRAKLGMDDKSAEAQSSRYRGTPPYSVAVGLQRLSERIGGLGDQTMVDYGCGAGRVMILGAEAGVGRAIGLELSPPLVSLCRENLARYTARSGSITEFEVMQADATAYIPPPQARLFYFFCPFNDAAFDRALDGIRISVRRDPRTVFVILFLKSKYDLGGLDLIAEVTGIRMFSNAADQQAFLDRSPPVGDLQ